MFKTQEENINFSYTEEQIHKLRCLECPDCGMILEERSRRYVCEDVRHCGFFISKNQYEKVIT